MGVKARGRAAVVILMVLVIGVSAAGTGWAQSPYPDEPASRPGLSGTQVLATLAAAVGSFFYIPFKAAAICPGMALASGASLALNRGSRETAEYYLRVGCTGTYLITPGMIRGQEDFQGSGYPEPETSMPMTGYR
ncbi:MAG TPA: hypothetical protein VLH58_13745 [Candidatus Methylomirabilis sp.]|nr:hypothetical protein [Candidatus Methylomirabilis sp.]HSC72414.1 hypothetical protein [Candidatus Methylomirabilis sp.]